MKRTKGQIQEAIEKIEAEVASLPAENAFGDSNDESLVELQEWLAALKRAKAGNTPGDEVVETMPTGLTISTIAAALSFQANSA